MYNTVQRGYIRKTDGMTVIAGKECHDGKWWLHVSCANTESERLPTWDDLKEVKNIFIGRFKKAIQILPDEKKYVNQNPYCLHLFHYAKDGLPDFTHEGSL